MSFHDDRLAVDIEKGAEGGLGFKTSVIQLASGFEKRNIDWSKQRGSWDISYGIQSQGDYEGVLNHFMTRRGRAYAFPFKDWLDFRITNQLIGLGDDVVTQFQAIKSYLSGPNQFNRVLYLIQPATYALELDGVPLTETTQYTIDGLTGVVTMVTAPASTGGTGPGGEEALTLTAEFNVPVRYDADQLRLTAEAFDAAGVASIDHIPLVEVRLTGGLI